MRYPVLFTLAATAALTATSVGAEITLSSGETIQAEIIELTATEVRLRHAVLGELTLDRGQITLPRHETPALAMLQDAETEAPKEWHTSVVVGGGLATGNTENANLAATIVATRENDETKTVLDAGYFFSSSDSDRTDNKATVGIVHDWFIPDSKWFYFADARLDYDEFQSWEERLSGHVGVGYELAKNDDFWLTGRVGLGAITEFNSPNEDVRLEALAGLDGAWQITAKQALEFSTTIYPDLDETGEFRWVSAVGWSVLLDEEMNLSLKAGVADEYQSLVAPGIKHNDLRAFAGLQFDF